MITEIRNDLFRVELPLPGNPLKAVYAYIIEGKERNLIIDTGMNRPECRQAIDEALHELNIDLNKSDLLVTHMHADHAGLISYLSRPASKIYGSRIDTTFLSDFYKDPDKKHWRELADYAVKNGFEEGMDAIFSHPGFKYSNQDIVEFEVVEDGEIINIGDYALTCVSTPGHTRGHICLYDADKKILFTGDHILSQITPNIALFADDYNPLQDYLNSLDKVFELEVDLVLPAHRKVFYNHRPRIIELKDHHQHRCEEILKILAEGHQNAYQTASMMSWDLKYDRWDDFPLPQKWFATGEAIAHLKYLHEKGQLGRTEGEGVFYYYLKQ